MNKLSELHDLLCGIPTVYDIICVTETWLYGSIADSLLTAGTCYNVYRCDRISGKGGGCAIFVHESLQCTQVSFPDSLCLGDIDSVCVALQLGLEKIVINCTYNPPEKSLIKIKCLCEIMNFICDKYLYYCIVGDFNLPDLYEVLRGSCQCPNMLKEIFDLILSHSLNQCVHSPTRGENFLDLIFFSQFLDVGTTEISVPFSTSDHNSIISNILLNFEANHSDIRLVHKNFKASNFDEFNRYLSSINWSNIFDDAESVNDLWTKFCDVLNLGIEKFVPDHVECCNSKRVLYPLYIRKMLLKKKQLWRQRYNANGGNGYKCSSLKCKVAIDKYHERREMAYLRVKNKNFYNFLNNRLRSHAKVPHMQNQNGTKDTDSINIANGFLNEFKNYFIKDNGTLPELKIKNPPDDFIQAVEITPQIVLKHMSSMNKQSAAGPDGLPGCLWFGLRYSTCDPLSIIFNKSMIMANYQMFGKNQ